MLLLDLISIMATSFIIRSSYLHEANNDIALTIGWISWELLDVINGLLMLGVAGELNNYYQSVLKMNAEEEDED